MRKMITAAVVLVAVLALGVPSVMAANGNGGSEKGPFEFLYKWLRDADGDGIPNCLDPDYVRPQDGSGFGNLGPMVSTGAGDQLRDQDQLKEKDQLKDGSCDDDCVPKNYDNNYLWKGAK